MHLALLLLLALQASAPAPAGQDPFAALRDQWAKDLHAKHIDDDLAQYAPDADFISDAGRTHGTAALRQLFETITATLDSDLAFTSERVEISGDLAYDSGTYKETLVTRATGKVQHMSGDYLTVYRRTRAANGNAVWLIVEQVWMGPPPE
ncbi:MAG: nuclear transport factor 2 family protein [Acidobacteriaceae bacterium]